MRKQAKSKYRKRKRKKREKGGKENTYIDNLAMVPVEMALVEIGIGNLRKKTIFIFIAYMNFN